MAWIRRQYWGEGRGLWRREWDAARPQISGVMSGTTVRALVLGRASDKKKLKYNERYGQNE